MQLLEEIRVGLERNDFSQQQRRVLQMKLLGELYNYCLFESHLVFDTLYTLLFYGHPNLPLTCSGSTNMNEYLEIDLPSDWFRVRVICTLLGTCGQFFERGALKKR